MTNTICLNENYSTTRLLTQEKPEIVNKPEDKFEFILFLHVSEEQKGEGGLRTKGYFKKSSEKKPLISIVTVVYNGEKYLEETILSVINQTYNNVEYIIIDGGSTDSTLDIIKKYDDKIDYWVSEKDSGIYDAMNKGVRLCTGDIIGIINSDDWYESSAFNNVSGKYLLTKQNLLIHASMNIIKNEKLYYVSTPISNLQLLKKGMVLNHPTIFVSKEIYKEVGLFSVEYKIAADWDFILRCHIKKINFVYIDSVLSNFRLGGVSSCTDRSLIEEKHAIRTLNKVYKLVDWYYYIELTKLKLFGKNVSKIYILKQYLLGWVR